MSKVVLSIEFDSIEEYEAYQNEESAGAEAPKTRRKRAPKGESTVEAPNPAAVPETTTLTVAQMPSFGVVNGPGAAGGFPGVTVQTPAAPQIPELAQRIINKLNAVAANGAAADQALKWLQTNCGPGAENATMEQMYSVIIPNLPQPSLETIVRAINA